MLKQIRTVIAVAGISLTALLTGCATSEGPQALTGDQAAEAREVARWTDQKGHYRPDWRAGFNRPAGMSDSVASQ